MASGSFGAWDYVVFAGMLLVSMGIGVFFAVCGGRQKTQGEFLMANRSMHVVPVSISILVSFLSAILILGTPAEMYTQGTQFFVSLFGMMAAISLASLLFVPLLFPLKMMSSFEYLERRFNSNAARLIGTIIMILTQIIYMGIASFAPATAFESVTGFPVWGTILITGAVATFYTTLGGMKAVVWTDVFQAGVMLAGMLTIVVQGINKVGSMSKVWEINRNYDRIEFFNFDFDPTVRHTFWGLTIGVTLQWIGTYGINQASVQRFSSLPTLQKAKISVALNMLGVFILVSITCLSGIVVFAYYANQNCDPLGQRLVKNPNQLIPLFVMETLNYPGVPGLFISSLFSGALSSVSSSLNALAAITWEDMLKPHLDSKFTESQKTAFTKLLVVLYGGCAIGMSFIATTLEGTVLQAAVSLIGAAAGPLTGMFVLGAFFPWANKWGVMSGAIVSLAMNAWLSIGAYVTGIKLERFPYPNGTCSAVENITAIATTTMSFHTNTTGATTLTTLAASSSESDVEKFYSISYLWFTGFGILICVVVGLIVSFITGANKMSDVPTKYQIPLFDRIFCCFPKSCRDFLQCHRFFEKPDDIRAEEKNEEIIIEDNSQDETREKTNGYDNLAFYNIPEYKNSSDIKPTSDKGIYLTQEQIMNKDNLKDNTESSSDWRIFTKL